MKWLVVLVAFVVGCAPKARSIEGPIARQIEQGIAQGTATLDHSTLDGLLATTVDFDRGRVDYAALSARRAELDTYLATLANAQLPSLGRDEQLALFVNAYNAFTLSLILDHYPGLASIRDLDAPWKTRAWNVGGHTLSLDDIEHGILRPIFRDERIHFAVNCAAIGCPPLADFAFAGARVHDQLDRVTRTTMRNPRYVDVHNDSLRVTKILDWYAADFTDPAYRGHASSISAWVGRWADDDVRTFIERKHGTPNVGFFEYDWRLNDVER